MDPEFSATIQPIRYAALDTPPASIRHSRHASGTVSYFLFLFENDYTWN
jgi:hypothetical protein